MISCKPICLRFILTDYVLQFPSGVGEADRSVSIMYLDPLRFGRHGLRDSNVFTSLGFIVRMSF